MPRMVRQIVVGVRRTQPDSLPATVCLSRSYTYFHVNDTCYRIVATILAPTPFVAALFITFSRVIQLLGVQYSRLSPRWCESVSCPHRLSRVPDIRCSRFKDFPYRCENLSCSLVSGPILTGWALRISSRLSFRELVVGWLLLPTRSPGATWARTSC